jgi:hypothetical protein
MLLVALMNFGCTTVPVSNGMPPSAEVDDRWSLQVVTIDEDGSDRVTRIWIATMDGEPVLRTGESRWWNNLQRDASIRIRLSGTDYPYRAESMERFEDKVRIDEIFLEKYGGWERALFSQERGKTHSNYARLRNEHQRTLRSVDIGLMVSN